MKIKKFLAVIFTFALCFGVTGCEDEPFSMADVVGLTEGEWVDLEPTFSKAEYDDEIEYEYDSPAIYIDDNDRCFAIIGEETVKVTASTEQHSTTFTVSTKNTPKKALSVSNVNAWYDADGIYEYPVSDFYVQSQTAYNPADVIYEYDGTALEIDALKQTVRGKQRGLHTVTAKLNGKEASFTVDVQPLYLQSSMQEGGTLDTTRFDTHAAYRQLWYEGRGGNDNSTLVLGDSFFDPDFWKDSHFYANAFSGKDAISLGLGGSTTFTWEKYLLPGGWMSNKSPKNIVINIGTNNLYERNPSVSALTNDLQRLFTLMHDRMPNTQIYWCSIVWRNGTSHQLIKGMEVNYNMRKWCQERDYITCVDMHGDIKSDMLYDGIHPSLQYYDLYVENLKEAGLQLAPIGGTSETPALLSVGDVLTWKPANGNDASLASNFYIQSQDDFLAQSAIYSYDTSALEIDVESMTIKGKKVGQYPVSLFLNGATTTFTVDVREVNYSSSTFDTSRFDGRIDGHKQIWRDRGGNANTTAVIGDSFFDPGYWKAEHFYDKAFLRKDAINIGLAASTTYVWEKYIQNDGWFTQLNPRNVVMNIGTNNIFDCGDDANATILALKRLFTLMHNELPNANIYWFSIAKRSNSSYESTISAINNAMKAWCQERDYITFIDVYDKITYAMLYDGVHPSLEYYDIYAEELLKTDIQIDKKVSANTAIPNLTNATTDNISGTASGIRVLSYRDMSLTDDYILSGKLDVTQLGDNAHVQIGVNTDQNRMLLWKKSDGNLHLYLGTSGAGVNATIPNEDKYAVNGTLTLNWTLVMSDGDGYFYLNGELKMVFHDWSGALMIGSEATACQFYDMTALTKEDDGTTYTTALSAYATDIATYGAQTNNARV